MMRVRRCFVGLGVVSISILVLPPSRGDAATADYVIHISVDGLGGMYLRDYLSTPQTPSDPYYNFSRFTTEGAFTFNARNDTSMTVTLPNHTSQLTGRPVAGTGAHNVTFNDDNGSTLKATNGGTYINGVFDTVHNAGKTTGFYATKDKFNYLIRSWGTAGEPTSKLDQVTNLTSGSTRSQTVVNDFVSDMSSAGTRSNYSFVHLHDPDTAGHNSTAGQNGGWGNAAYATAVASVDDYLGQIFSLVETNSALKGKTAIILTADHGGFGFDHGTANDARDYTIPFMVWGPGVAAGTDLYLLNLATKADPGSTQTAIGTGGQPIRGGEISNFGLSLMGLSAISGSVLNSGQTLTASGLAQKTIGFTNFAEPAAGTANFTPSVGQKELSFTTSSSPTGVSPIAATRAPGTADTIDEPILTHQSVSATTTFATLSLAGYYNVRVSVDIRVAATTYETTDQLQVTLINGANTLTVVDLDATELNLIDDSGNDGYINYSLAIPNWWTQATLVIHSLSDSSAGAERYDFDNIRFTGAVPEPASMGLIGVTAIGLLGRRRTRRAS